MRVAMIGLRGVPATYGGVETAVEAVGAELASLGHDVTVFCRRAYYEDQPSEYRGMRLHYLPSTTTRGVEALVHSGLATASAMHGHFDVIHYHAMGPGLFTPLPHVASRAAVVQTIHGLDNQRAKWGRGAKRLLDLGAWLSARVPDELITVSRDLARYYEQHWGRATTQIRNAASALSPAATVTPPPVDGRYVLFSGRIVPEKRIDDLILAFASAPRDVQLVIAGGGGQADDYGRYIASLAASDDRVRLLGHVDRPVLETLYAHAAAFVLPSALEGMPVALLEAAAGGVPLIASRIPPHEEVLGGGPGQRLFTVGDRAELAALLDDVLRSPELEAAGARALQSAVLNRTWRDVANATLFVYEKALFGQPRAAERRATPRLAAAAA